MACAWAKPLGKTAVSSDRQPLSLQSAAFAAAPCGGCRVLGVLQQLELDPMPPVGVIPMGTGKCTPP